MAQKYAVPLGSEKPQIMMPWAQYRFAIRQCNDLITQNVNNLDINFATKTIMVVVRASIEAVAFEAAEQFAKARIFRIDAMDGSVRPYFSVIPQNLKLINHVFSLTYANS